MFTVSAFNKMGFVPCGRVSYVVDDDADDDDVDIDNPRDFVRAEILLNRHIKKIGTEHIHTNYGNGSA